MTLETALLGLIAVTNAVVLFAIYRLLMPRQTSATSGTPSGAAPAGAAPGDLVVEPLPPTPTSRVQAQDRLTQYLLDEFQRSGRPISRAEAEAQASVMMDQVLW